MDYLILSDASLSCMPKKDNNNLNPTETLVKNEPTLTKLWAKDKECVTLTFAINFEDIKLDDKCDLRMVFVSFLNFCR